MPDNPAPQPPPPHPGEILLGKIFPDGGGEGEQAVFGAPLPLGEGLGRGLPELLSLVIPVYNERESLGALHAEIAEVAAKLTERVEIIFVDDGSKDDSWQVVRDLVAKDEHVRGIKFRRNFGKAAAL